MTELIIIIVYFLVMVAIGLVDRRKVKGIDDFLVAGRKKSTLFITGSLLATIIGGSAIMVTTQLGFSQGLTGVWWLLVGSIGLLVLGFFFAKKVRKFALYTLPELVGKQYDEKTKLASSILIVVAWTGVIAAQIIAAGKIMGVLGIGDPMLWMVIFTVVFLAYIILGGQHAIIRTDTLQTVIIFTGVFGVLALVLSRVGGIGGLENSLPSEHFDFPLTSGFGGYELAKYILLVGLTYVVGPDMYSRIFCAKDENVAKKSVISAALLIIPFAIGVTLIGMGASALFPSIEAGQAFPTIITEMLPPVLGGIVLAALLCAFMSSADTTLLSASTILTVDIIGHFKPLISQKKILFISKLGIIALGLVSLLLALYLGNIIDAILFAYTIYTAGLILPVIAGFYKNRLKVTPLGALMALIGGGSAALISKIFDIKYLDLYALLICALLLFTVSIIDNRLRNKR
ncbi:MAG: sodium:solute symporter family protein [Chloroflexota bacterium]